jgi:hypothetical protein
MALSEPIGPEIGEAMSHGKPINLDILERSFCRSSLRGQTLGVFCSLAATNIPVITKKKFSREEYYTIALQLRSKQTRPALY